MKAPTLQCNLRAPRTSAPLLRESAAGGDIVGGYTDSRGKSPDFSQFGSTIRTKTMSMTIIDACLKIENNIASAGERYSTELIERSEIP